VNSRFGLSLLAAAAVLPLLAFAAAMAWLFGQQAQRDMEQQLRFAARAGMAAVDRELAAELASLVTLAESTRLDGSATTDEFRKAAARALTSRADWLAIRVSDAEGRLQFDLRTEGAPAPAHSVERGIAEAARRVEPVAGAYLGRPAAGQKSAVALHAPIRRADGSVLVLTLELAASALSEALGTQPMSAAWTAAVLDRDHVIVGRNRTPERYVGFPATPSLRAELDRAPESFFFALTQEGDRVYTAFSTSGFSGWTVAVGAPADAVEGPARRSLMMAGAGGAGALAVSLAHAAGLARASSRRQAAERRLVAAEAQAQAERRVADIADNLPGVVYRRLVRPDGSFRYLDARGDVERLFFVPREQLLRPRTLEQEVARIAAEDRPGWIEQTRHSAATLEPFANESRLQAPDGGLRWVRSMARPRRLTDGSVVWDGVSLDITDLKLAEAALSASEQRFRDVVETASDWIWETDSEHRFTWLSETVVEATGLPVERVLGRTRSDFIAETAEQHGLDGHLADLAARRPFRNFIYWMPDAYGRRCISASGKPVFDERGRFLGYRGAASDVTERERAAAQRELIMAELDHRVKNTLAVVKALIEQTARGAGSIDDFRADLDGRLRALADTHDLLRAERWRGASLRGLVGRALAPHQGSDGRVRIGDGPDVTLQPVAATAIVMALHELATNAIKHGALSRPEGHVEVDWSATDDEFVLRWRERGGPVVSPPRRRGFGREVIERGLAYELDAHVRLDFEPEGVVCEIRAQLDQLRAADGRAARIAASGSAE
jgi:PAS domain S-box-containing protein